MKNIINNYQLLRMITSICARLHCILFFLGVGLPGQLYGSPRNILYPVEPQHHQPQQVQIVRKWKDFHGTPVKFEIHMRNSLMMAIDAATMKKR
jgi:hypothetical protein